MTEPAADIQFGFVAAATDRPGASDAELYAALLSDCAHNAALGYRSVWLIEHHFSDYFPTPSPLLLLAHIAARYPQLALGTCVLVTPWYDALRLAEDIAMLRLLTDQPLHLGLGRGTAQYEYDAFGIDMTESRDRFAEIFDIIRIALAGEPFTYQGRHCNVPKQIRLRPQVDPSAINLYGAIGNPDTAPLIGRMGLLPMCTSVGDYNRNVENLRNWQTGAEEAGHPTTGRRPIMVNCIVGDTDEDAIRQAQTYIPLFMQAQIDHYTADTTDWAHTAGYEKWQPIFQNMKRLTDPANIPAWCEAQFVGSPDTLKKRVAGFVDAGFDTFLLHTSTPGVPVDVRHEWMTRFAHEVAPAFEDLVPQPLPALA